MNTPLALKIEKVLDLEEGYFMIYWCIMTLTSLLGKILTDLMQTDAFTDFRLAGGTALSLHTDLFTGVVYSCFNKYLLMILINFS